MHRTLAQVHMANEQLPQTGHQLTLTFEALQSLYTQVSEQNTQLPTLQSIQAQIDHLNECQKFNDSGGPISNKVTHDESYLMLIDKINEKKRSRDQVIQDYSTKNGELLRQIEEKRVKLSSREALRDSQVNPICS